MEEDVSFASVLTKRVRAEERYAFSSQGCKRKIKRARIYNTNKRDEVETRAAAVSSV